MSIESKRRFTYVWKIENFTFYELGETPKTFTSPPFCLFCNIAFYLFFDPTKYLVIMLYLKSDSAHHVDYQLQIGTHTTEKKSCLWNNENIRIYFKNIIYDTYNDWLTIKLSMWRLKEKREKMLNNNYFLVANGGIEVYKLQFFWNVKEFGCIASERVFLPQFGHLGITLRKSDDYINVTIVLNSKCDISGKPFRCEVIILGLDGRIWKTDPKLHILRKKNKIVKYPLSVKVSDLVKEKFLFPSNNNLSLCFNFAIQTGDIDPKIKCLQSGEVGLCDQKSAFDTYDLRTEEYLDLTLGFNQRDDKDLNSAAASKNNIDSKLATFVDKQCRNDNSNIDLLCGDLKRMYIDRKMTDIVFQVGEKTLPAHKFVLAARSPVFMTMFEQDMLENKSGIIDVKDVEYNTLDSMLLFMYGGKLQDICYESAIKLLVASHKYQIVLLQERCSMILQSMVNADTICEILVYSDMVQDIELKEFAVEYFKVNTKCILQSAEWKELLKNHIQLATEVLTEYAMAK